jgi:putative endonuclease
MPYLVYVLKSLSTGKFYIGQTNNLTRRLLEHNRGKKLFDRLNSPFETVYFEQYSTRVLAVRREIFLKTGPGRKE